MSPTSRYEAFQSFTVETLPQARYAARLATGTPDAAELVVQRAYVDIARQWSLASADDPRARLLAAVERQTARLGEENEDISGDAPPDAHELAPIAWEEARRVTGGRRRMWFSLFAVATLLVGGYLLSLNSQSDLPGDGEQSGDRATAIEEGLSVLPPPRLLSDSPRVRTGIPNSDADFTSSARPLSESAVEVFAGAFALANGTVGVLGRDRIPRLLDSDEVGHNSLLHPRSISTRGDRVALTTDDQVSVVSTDAEVEHLDLPEGFSEPSDLAWSPDDESIMVSTETATVTLDSRDGEPTPRDWYGPASTFLGDDLLVEFISLGANGAVQRWRDGSVDGEPEPVGAAIAGWQDVPFSSDGLITRECLPAPELEVPRYYGTPALCVAVLDDTGDVTQLLTIPDDYEGTDEVRVLGVREGLVHLIVKPRDSPQRRLLSWNPETQALQVLSTLDKNQTFALGQL